MKLFTGFLGLLVASQICVASANDINDIAKRLSALDNFESQVKVLVTLPMSANDEVEYSLIVSSQKSSGDTLLPISYLIDWSLPVGGSVSHGFSAYSNGNFYRFRDNGGRLQEYHFDNTPDLFTGGVPVQRSAQFFEATPFALGAEMSSIASDSTYIFKFTADTVYKGQPADIVQSRRHVNDIEVANCLYVFDSTTGAPIYIEKEMSPGSISEQTVAYSYSYPSDGNIKGVPTDEDSLIALYPEIFSLYREGNYGLSSLKGLSTPAFSLPTLQGDRYNHTRDEAFNSPVIMAFVDENISTTSDVISQVRNALNRIPANVDVFWIFLSNRRDDIEAAVGKVQPGETVLTSGRNIVKDFGVTETPTLIFIDRKGKVSDNEVGYNKNLDEIVINKVTVNL